MLLLHDDIIISILSFDNPSFISFCRIPCMSLNLPLLLFEILVVDRPDCKDCLHSLGLSLVPVLTFATAGSRMVGWANGVLSGDRRSLLSLFFGNIL